MNKYLINKSCDTESFMQIERERELEGEERELLS